MVHYHSANKLLNYAHTRVTRLTCIKMRLRTKPHGGGFLRFTFSEVTIALRPFTVPTEGLSFASSNGSKILTLFRSLRVQLSYPIQYSARLTAHPSKS